MTARSDLDQRTRPVRDTGLLITGPLKPSFAAMLSAGDTWGAGAQGGQLPLVRHLSWLSR